MAKYSSQFSSVTMAVSPLGSAVTSATGVNGFMGLLNASSTGLAKISEVYMGGEAASASQVASMALTRATTLANTATAGLATSILTDATATAPASTPLAFTQWVTTAAPVGSANALLHLSYNAYGGIVRWVSSPDQNITLFGTAAFTTQGTGGEVLLTQIAGTASAMSGHILYEIV
jgi:hypothetical protein